MGGFEFNRRVQCISEADPWNRHIATVIVEKGLRSQNISRCIRKGDRFVDATAFRVSIFQRNYQLFWNLSKNIH